MWKWLVEYLLVVFSFNAWYVVISFILLYLWRFCILKWFTWPINKTLPNLSFTCQPPLIRKLIDSTILSLHLEYPIRMSTCHSSFVLLAALVAFSDLLRYQCVILGSVHVLRDDFESFLAVYGVLFVGTWLVYLVEMVIGQQGLYKTLFIKMQHLIVVTNVLIRPRNNRLLRVILLLHFVHWQIMGFLALNFT